MSTAGKVLTVLILLVMVVWLVMMSGVSQLNANHALKIKTQQEQLDKLIVDADKATNEFHRLTEATRSEQENTDRLIRVLMARIAGAEALKSKQTESLERIKEQLKAYLDNVEKAKTNLATREAELMKVQDDLAKKRDEIAKAQVVNTDLRTQLAQLQDEFKRLLAENTAAVNKAKEQGPSVKPASNRRPSPAS